MVRQHNRCHRAGQPALSTSLSLSLSPCLSCVRSSNTGCQCNWSVHSATAPERPHLVNSQASRVFLYASSHARARQRAHSQFHSGAKINTNARTLSGYCRIFVCVRALVLHMVYVWWQRRRRRRQRRTFARFLAEHRKSFCWKPPPPQLASSALSHPAFRIQMVSNMPYNKLEFFFSPDRNTK